MKLTQDSGKICAVCRFSFNIPETGDILCVKKGIVSEEYYCRKFLYDPLKRKPRRMADLPVPDDLRLGDFWHSNIDEKII